MAKGLQAKSVPYTSQGETICDLSSNDCWCAVKITAEANE